MFDFTVCKDKSRPSTEFGRKPEWTFQDVLANKFWNTIEAIQSDRERKISRKDGRRETCTVFQNKTWSNVWDIFGEQLTFCLRISSLDLPLKFGRLRGPRNAIYWLLGAKAVVVGTPHEKIYAVGQPLPPLSGRTGCQDICEPSGMRIKLVESSFYRIQPSYSSVKLRKPIPVCLIGTRLYSGCPYGVKQPVTFLGDTCQPNGPMSGKGLHKLLYSLLSWLASFGNDVRVSKLHVLIHYLVQILTRLPWSKYKFTTSAGSAFSWKLARITDPKVTDRDCKSSNLILILAEIFSSLSKRGSVHSQPFFL